MSFVYTKEFRKGKGRKLAVVGRVGGTGVRTANTPTDIAIKNLVKALGKSVTDEKRKEFIDVAKNIEQLRFMNMPVLAATFVFMESTGYQFSADRFRNESIAPYIQHLMSGVKENDRAVVFLKLKEEIARYSLVIIEARAPPS